MFRKNTREEVNKMSKKKTTTKSKPKNRTIIKISAVLLGIIAVAYVVISIVFGAWNPIEWGREKEKNVMTINARTLTEKEYAIYGLTDVPLGAKLLSVEFEPADASDRRIKWAVYFENESSAWSSGKKVTDYMQLNPIEHGEKATLQMKQAFGERIIVKAECYGNKTLTSTISIERVARIDDLWDGGSRGVDSLSDTLVFCSEYANSTDSNGLPYTVLPNEFRGTVNFVMDTALYDYLHNKQGVEYDDATDTGNIDISQVTTWNDLFYKLGLNSWHYPHIAEYMYTNSACCIGSLHYSIDYYYSGEKIGSLENYCDVELNDSAMLEMQKPITNITINPDKVVF